MPAPDTQPRRMPCSSAGAGLRHRRLRHRGGGHPRGLTGRKVELVLDGGSLFIEWREEDGHVLMTGPTAMPFRGRLELDKL